MKEILFLAHRAPWPPDRGDRIRSWHVLRYLAARARVHLVAFADSAAEAMVAPELAAVTASATIVPRTKGRVHAAAEALVRGRPVSLTAFADARIVAAMTRVLAERPIDAVYAFSGQMAQYLPGDGPRAIMDFVDVDSAKFTGLAGGPLGWVMRREARLLGAFERDVAARVEASLFVSETEAALFRAGGANGRVEVVENGIDAAFFAPTGEAEPGLVVFTGQMDYAPNVEAVCWFAREVLPLLPEARFAIVGRAPTGAVRALAEARIEVTGEVADVRPWLARAAVCVAPLRVARGVQNKVLEAMAMARPVVASPAAAEGIAHDGTIRVAEGASAFAAAVAGLLADADAAGRLGAAARAQVIRRYDWEARLAPLDALLGLAA